MTTIRLTTITSLRQRNDNNIYLLTSVDEKEKDAIFKAHKEKEDYKIQVNDNLFIDIKNILSFGSVATAKPGNITDYVGYLLGPKQGGSREKHYRDYALNEKQQDNTKHYINMCVDKVSSAKSAFKALKEEYCFVWYIPCELENFYSLCNIYNI